MAQQLTTQNGQVEVAVGSESFGTSIIAILVKRSYRIIENQPAQRLDEDAPFRRVDQQYDGAEPTEATVEHEFELAPLKSLTDVVVVGNAYAPYGRPCQQMTASVSVADQTKSLLITGDRTCSYVQNGSPAFSDPAPFAVMPIRYERAYGGKDELSDPQLPFRYPRNDLGTGLALSNKREVIDALRLPNIEDASDLLTPERVVIGDPKRWQAQPLPQGFGWRQRTWFPRGALIGSYPAFLDTGTRTAEEKMGWLPQDYVSLAKQFRLAPNLPLFANGASFGLAFERLPEDASIVLTGLTPSSALAFQLPSETPQIALDVGRGAEALQTKLFTVSIEPDKMTLNMIWAGHYSVGEYARWSLIKNLQPEVM